MNVTRQLSTSAKVIQGFVVDSISMILSINNGGMATALPMAESH